MSPKSVRDSTVELIRTAKSSFVCQSCEGHLPRTVDLDTETFCVQ